MSRFLRPTVASLIFLTNFGVLTAQDVQVNRDNRTISVTVTESIKVEPELAIVTLGYQNFAHSKELAYQENVRVGNKINKALLDAGVPKDMIRTENLKLGRTQEYELQNALKKGLDYAAHQTLTVRIAASDAGKIVDLAVAAGSNDVEDVTWAVTDLPELEAKAHAAAFVKAKSLAEHLASNFGVKLGDLLYASNTQPMARPQDLSMDKRVRFKFAEVAAPGPQLNLFPQKVEREATVHAVFAIQ